MSFNAGATIEPGNPILSYFSIKEKIQFELPTSYTFASKASEKFKRDREILSGTLKAKGACVNGAEDSSSQLSILETGLINV